MADVRDPARSSSRSSSTRWIVVGGIVSALSLLALVPMAMQNLRPIGIPGTAAVVVCTLYFGMIIVCMSTPRGRLRRVLLALDVVAIVFVTVLTAVLVAGRLGG